MAIKQHTCIVKEVYTCWIFLGSHLNRVLQSFLLFTFDFDKFLMTMFRSRLKFGGWEKALFPLAERFRTSRKRLSCCLKSYSTLDRQDMKPNINKNNPLPPRKCRCMTQYVYNSANEPAEERIYSFPFVHQALLAPVNFALCGAPRVGSFVLVRFQIGWLVSAGRHSPGRASLFFFVFFLKVHTSHF